MYLILIVIAVPLLGIFFGLVLWRQRARQHRLPRSIRRMAVLAARSLLRLEMLMSRYHNWVLLVYVLLFASFITRQSLLEHIGAIGEIALYCFYGLAVFNLLAQFIARALLDPVPKVLTDDTQVPLDLTKVNLVPPDNLVRFNQLVDLGEEAFAAWGGSKDDRHVAYTKFVQANPDSFKLIMRLDMEEPIGFSSVIPIDESAFRQFRLGILESWDFSPGDILRSSDYLCLNAIYIQRMFQNEYTRAVAILCNHIAIFARSSETVNLPVLVADGLTLEGRRFLKRYGFESCYRTRDQTPIYELDLSRPGILSDRGRAFASCLITAINEAAVVE